MKQSLRQFLDLLCRHARAGRGFTLMETLFAILIFTSSLVMLMAVSARGLGATITSREELTARYLAVEGLEVVRNIRDSNYLATGADWLSGIAGVCEPECHVVVEDGAAPGLAANAAIVYVDPETGGYVSVDRGGSTPTKFIQTILVTPTDGDREVLVTSRIEWTARGNRNKKVEYSNYLEQWR